MPSPVLDRSYIVGLGMSSEVSRCRNRVVQVTRGLVVQVGPGAGGISCSAERLLTEEVALDMYHLDSGEGVAKGKGGR